MIPLRVRRALETLTHPHSLDQVSAAFRRSWTGELVGTVTAVERLTPRSVAISFRTNSSWPGHTAGQYVPVGFEIDGRRETRTYSLTTASSRPGSQVVSIAVQRVDGGLVSNALNDHVAVGSTLFLGAPMGEFTLDGARPLAAPADQGPTSDTFNANTPLLFIGGGSGMTPIRGLLAELIERRERTGAAPEVTVIAYAPSATERLFDGELADAERRYPWLTVHRINLASTVGPDDPNTLGPALLDCLAPEWRSCRAFACGPAGLLDGAETTFAAAGVRDRLTVERFTRLLPPSDGHAASESVTVALRDASRELVLRTDTPLLDSIEAAGQLAPSGCRNGICHTCSVELVDGCAINLRDGRISEAGSHVQLCICAPLTNLTLAL